MSPASAVRLQTLTRQRALRKSDAILALGGDQPWETWRQENLLAELPDKWALSLLATVDGKPVAYAVASHQGDALHLHHLIVGASCRGWGLGVELMKRLERRARARKLARITLKVARSNQRALSFYFRLGFVEDADRARNDLLFLSVCLRGSEIRRGAGRGKGA